MPTDNYLPVLEGTEWPSTEAPSRIHVAYDEENNSVTFHDRETGELMHSWVPAKILDHADGLMTHRKSTSHRVLTLQDVHIGAADRGRRDAEESVRGTDRRNGLLL